MRVPAIAQSNKVFQVGLVTVGAPGTSVLSPALVSAFAKRGYVDGQNIVLQDSFADGDVARLPALAADLVRQNVDVIVGTSPPAVRAGKDATRTIPIVMITGDDPVRSGYVASLARPGGNITGVTLLSVDLFAKQMELLKQLVPELRHVAFLWNPDMPSTAQDLTDVRTAAGVLGLQLHVIEARGADDYESAFAAMTMARTEALVTVGSPTFIQDRSLCNPSTLFQSRAARCQAELAASSIQLCSELAF